MRKRKKSSSAFTLIELLVVMLVIALLAALMLPALARSKASAWRADCASNLRQLGLATHLYWDDNHGACFQWSLGPTNGGWTYWFGWIGPGQEGQRALDLSAGALYPYLGSGKTRLCPAFDYVLGQFKLKADQATYGYGYNLNLSNPNINAGQLHRPVGLCLFADAAQINDFQAPASRANPMLEEWYYVDDPTNAPGPGYYPHVHFRHSQKANVVFGDGHAATEACVPGSIDPKLPNQLVGRLRPEILAVP